MSRARILADYVSSGDELALKAPLASPTFTGTVAIPNIANVETAITANTAKVTNATHTGDVTGATALTIATDAVDLAMLSATGTADGTTFLRGDNTWNAPAGGGIEYASQWNLTSTITPGEHGTTLLSAWQESTTGLGKLGASMGHSSGEFYFPSGGEGHWLVTARPYYRLSSSDTAARMLNFYCRKTDDDWSSYKTPLWVTQSMEVQNSDTTFSTAFGSAILDIVSAGSGGNDKLQFYFVPSDQAYTGRLIGDTDNDNYKTVLTFIRLGDT